MTISDTVLEWGQKLLNDFFEGGMEIFKSLEHVPIIGPLITDVSQLLQGVAAIVVLLVVWQFLGPLIIWLLLKLVPCKVRKIMSFLQLSAFAGFGIFFFLWALIKKCKKEEIEQS
jgi:hypothetical protein